MKIFSVMTYNMCFGMKANTALSAFYSSWFVVHGGKGAEFIKERINLNPFFELLEKINPDVLVLNEVFDDLSLNPIKEKLLELGYKFIFVGNSEHHEKPLLISTIIATKENSVLIENPLKFVKGMPGSGGGAVAIEVLSLNVCILGCHLAFKSEYLIDHVLQLDEFYENLRTQNRTAIFVGDFNRSPSFLKKVSKFAKEMKAALSDRTFPSFFPFYKFMAFLSDNLVVGSVDNMYYQGVEVVDKKVVKSLSDHKIAVVRFVLK